MDKTAVKEWNDVLKRGIIDEVNAMINMTNDDINSQLELQTKLTDLLRILRQENGKQFD